MEFTTKETKDGKRYYYMDGVAYPSVTTILSVIDKSGPLVGWAVRETCDYIDKTYPPCIEPKRSNYGTNTGDTGSGPQGSRPV